VIVGIDLGTTNSAVAVWHEGETRLIPNALGECLTPSAVSLDADGRTYVGVAALDRFGTRSTDTALSFKRFMGTEHTVQLGKRRFKPEDLSALILRSLCDDVKPRWASARPKRLSPFRPISTTVSARLLAGPGRSRALPSDA